MAFLRFEEVAGDGKSKPGGVGGVAIVRSSKVHRQVLVGIGVCRPHFSLGYRVPGAGSCRSKSVDFKATV